MGYPIVAWTPERELRELHLAQREAQWWCLEPGEDGYDSPLHEYLGFTEEQWRERTWMGMSDDEWATARG